MTRCALLFHLIGGSKWLLYNYSRQGWYPHPSPCPPKTISTSSRLARPSTVRPSDASLVTILPMYLLSTVLPPSSCQFSERLKASWNSVPHNTVNILIPHAQYLAMMNTLKNTMMTIRNPPHTINIRDMKNRGEVDHYPVHQDDEHYPDYINHDGVSPAARCYSLFSIINSAITVHASFAPWVPWQFWNVENSSSCFSA